VPNASGGHNPDPPMGGVRVAEPTAWPAALEPLARELDRTVDRLRSRSLTRLTRAWDPAQSVGPTAAQAGAALAQRLADAAAVLEGTPARDLPDAEPHVVPDVLAVTGHDLLLALAARDAVDGVADPAPDVGQQIVEAIAALRRFRSVL
jgi:hypothetical protein